MISSKVKASTIGGGLAGIVVGIIISILQAQGVELSAEWIGIITTVVAAALSFLGGFIRQQIQRRV